MNVFVMISSGLAEGQTRVYVDNSLKGTLRVENRSSSPGWILT